MSWHAWFFSTGGTKPRLLGYTLGYQIVGAWLDTAEVPDAQTWVNIPAATVPSAARAVPGALLR